MLRKVAVGAALTVPLVFASSASATAIVTVGANPASLPAPGGNFTFTVSIASPTYTMASEENTVNKMTDGVYGDLTAECGPFPRKAPFTCSYTRAFNGSAGTTQTNTVGVETTQVITPDLMPPLPPQNVTASGSTTISLTATGKKKCKKGKRLVTRKGKKKCVKKKRKS